MTRKSLVDIVESLDPKDAPEGGFVASRISQDSQVRLGRGRSCIALLVPAVPESASEPDLRLENLRVTHFARCSVLDGSESLSGEFGIIECTSEDAGVRGTFLDVLEWLVPGSGDLTTPEAKELFGRVIRLLSPSDAPSRTSALGLWGELFIMGLSDDISAWARAWHITPRDRWDFAFRDERVEVKTSSGARRHHFSLDQLACPPGVETLVISLVTTPSSSGPTIRELLQRLVLQVDTEVRDRLIETAIASLGDSWTSGSESRFDDRLASDSVRVFASHRIPQVAPPPPEVSEVRFVVDLTDVEPTGGLESVRGMT